MENILCKILHYHTYINNTGKWNTETTATKLQKWLIEQSYGTGNKAGFESACSGIHGGETSARF